MGSRLLLGLFVAAAVGGVLYVALSGGDPSAIDEREVRPIRRPDEPVVPPPVVPEGAPAPTAGENTPVQPATVADGTGIVVVSVTDPEKQPIAGAHVRLGERAMTTGTAGSARYENVPAGTRLNLIVEGPNPDDVRARMTVRAKKDGEIHRTVVIRAGGRVVGIVYGPGGAPLATGFRVRLDPAGNSELRALGYVGGNRGTGQGSRNTPAGDGTFTLRGVAPGGYVAHVEADGYVKGQSEPFLVTEGATTEGVDVTLSLGGRVSGVVVDATSGKPVAGARVGLGDDDVQVVSTGGGGMLHVGNRSVTADEAGAFVIPDAKPGTYRVNAAAKGYTQASVKGVVVTPGAETGGLRLALGRGGTITGVVYGPDGKPKPGQDVLIQRVMKNFDIGGDFGQRATTDANGRYRAEGLDPGRYRVKLPQASANAGVVSFAMSGDAADEGEKEDDTPLEPDMVRVREDQVVTKDIRAELRATVKGVVTGADGKPLREQVQLQRVRPKSGNQPNFQFPQMSFPRADGTFEFKGIEPGRWRLACGDVAETIELAPGEVREMEIVLAPARIEGIVVDETGRGLAGARVTLTKIRTAEEAEEEGGFHFGNTTGRPKTDAGGRFQIPKVHAGRYVARARKAGMDGVTAEFDVPRGGLVKDVRIVMESLTELRVKVLDAEGKPVAGSWVSASGNRPGTDANGRAAADGVAKIQVRSGPQNVSAFHDGKVGTAKVTVRAGNPQEIEIRLK